ncbi:MAG: hypothetical protein QF539_05845, partial [Luminiphilus sp.]|nr:hypothetical protein [Luminiphilus sp.]
MLQAAHNYEERDHCVVMVSRLWIPRATIRLCHAQAAS